MDFAKKLSQIMNFDYEFVEPVFGTFGEKINGTWNGVVGDLAIGVGPIAMGHYCYLTNFVLWFHPPEVVLARKLAL